MSRFQTLSEIYPNLYDYLKHPELKALKAVGNTEINEQLGKIRYYEGPPPSPPPPIVDLDGPPPQLQLQLMRADAEIIRQTLFIILNNESCEVIDILSGDDIEPLDPKDDAKYKDLPEFLRKNRDRARARGHLKEHLAKKTNDNYVSTYDIYDESVELLNTPSVPFRIVKNGRTISLKQMYNRFPNGQTEPVGNLVYNQGELEGQNVVFDEYGRVISYPVRNSFKSKNKTKKSKKSSKTKKSKKSLNFSYI